MSTSTSTSAELEEMYRPRRMDALCPFIEAAKEERRWNAQEALALAQVEEEAAAEWAETERLAALYDPRKGGENDAEVELAYDMVQEKLFRAHFAQIEPLFRAKQQAAYNLQTASTDYDQQRSAAKRKAETIVNLSAALRVYDECDRAWKQAEASQGE